MNDPRIAITMLHWGSAETTAAALRSLAAIDRPAFQIFLVDQTGALELTLPANARLIVPESNLGFSGGHNLAIKRVMAEGGYDYVLMLNNDVMVSPDSLERLVATMEQHPRAAAVGPTVLYDEPADEIWYGGGELRLREGRVRHLNLNRQLADLPFDEATRVTFVTGCSLMMRVAAVEQVGLLNDQYFMYWEDVDWCARAQDLGYELYYEPTAIVAHTVSSSFGVSSPDFLYYFLRNNLLFIRLHVPWRWKPLAWWISLVFVGKEIVKLFVRYRREYRNYFRSIGLALYHNAIRRYDRRP